MKSTSFFKRRQAHPFSVLLLLGLSWTAAARVSIEAAEKATSEPLPTAAQKTFWSFQKPHGRGFPQVVDKSWIRTPIDHFVLATLEQHSLGPAKSAVRDIWLRRITFDLIGLPPTFEEMENFLADISPCAERKVVDRLLASPHYGERWAQHWLDIVRYADSNGYEMDGERPNAWRYRDYVIRAFNVDLPYDRFVTEQLAGDLLSNKGAFGGRSELLIAAGFNRCGPVHLVSGNTDPEVNRQEVLTEMTDAVGSTFLGITIGCARCHDHKFDPISQADYYRLQALFGASQPREVDLATAEDKIAYKTQLQDINQRLAPLEKKVADLEAPYRTLLTQLKKASLETIYHDALAIPSDKRTPEQKKVANHALVLIKVAWAEVVQVLSPQERARRANWRAEIHALQAQMPPPPAAAWTIGEDSNAPGTHILKRGNPKHKGPAVEPAFPKILSEDSSSGQSTRLSRLDLARWLTRPEHPLTARVLVNRLWQHHFGRGLVGTPNDFGFRGERPSHPELLDWLACDFVSHGWSIKHMHRLMMLSNTYRQESRTTPTPVVKKADPDNRFLWRMPRQRLEGEVLRDSVLAVAGKLNHSLGGPIVRVPLEPEVYDLLFSEDEPDGLWHVTPDFRQHERRSIYLFSKRNLRLPMLEAFDRPDTLTSCPVRPVSTFAPQALIMMNGPFLTGQSRAFATRLVSEAGSDIGRQIDLAYRIAFGRRPRSIENQFAREFLARQTKTSQFKSSLMATDASITDTTLQQNAALADFCLALLNANEFIFIR